MALACVALPVGAIAPRSTTWNALTLDIIKAEKTSGPMAARNLAMVHAAIYDAAKAIGLALIPALSGVTAEPGIEVPQTLQIS